MPPTDAAVVSRVPRTRPRVLLAGARPAKVVAENPRLRNRAVAVKIGGPDCRREFGIW
jgi:hypothetical protein